MERTHNYHGQMDDVASSDDNSYSVSPGANENKLRPRPRKSLASFASYLGAHHRTISHTSRPEWPSIDWSNMNILNDKDGVYKPDTELMCTTITGKLLANPSADLPAQYNTFLLHLLEVYHQSKAEVQDLQSELAEKNDCSQSNVSKMHEEGWHRPLEKVDMIQGLENVNSITLRSTSASRRQQPQNRKSTILRSRRPSQPLNTLKVARSTNRQTKLEVFQPEAVRQRYADPWQYRSGINRCRQRTGIVSSAQQPQTLNRAVITGQPRLVNAA